MDREPVAAENGSAFDLTLAEECAEAFSRATGLGCAVTGSDGCVYRGYGYSCAGCRMCMQAGLAPDRCRETQLYGMHEAERFGGKYVYFCAMGMTCFVSPIIGRGGTVAKITVGPFLMVDRTDYLSYELQELLKLPPERIPAVQAELRHVPFVEPSNVAALSTLLFMSVGFMNDVSAANDRMQAQRTELLQKQLSAYVTELKRDGQFPAYPFRQEDALTQAMLQGDREKAQSILNELLGHVLFSSGGDFRWIRARCFELLVVLSRTAVKNGADPELILHLGDEYAEIIPACPNIEELSMRLSEALRRFMDAGFGLRDGRHADAVHNAVYFIRRNYREKITLDDAARYVYLSPTYLSRVFKQETGIPFTRFLNNVRVEKSKSLLTMTEMRLTEIAAACGFEDQSYFTKVFRAVTGETPQRYRKCHSASQI